MAARSACTEKESSAEVGQDKMQVLQCFVKSRGTILGPHTVEKHTDTEEELGWRKPQLVQS